MAISASKTSTAAYLSISGMISKILVFRILDKIPIQNLCVANVLAVNGIVDHPSVGRNSRLPGGEDDFGKVINPVLGRGEIKDGHYLCFITNINVPLPIDGQYKRSYLFMPSLNKSHEALLLQILDEIR